MCNSLYRAVRSEPEKLVIWVATVISKYDDVIDDVNKNFHFKFFPTSIRTECNQPNVDNSCTDGVIKKKKFVPSLSFANYFMT